MRAELEQTIAALEAVGNTKGAAQLKLELQEVNLQLDRINVTAGDTTFIGRMIAGVRQLAVEWGNTAQQISGFLAGSFQTLTNSAAQALTGLIFRTGNWRQAFAQAAQSIVQNLIQIVLQWTIGQLVMAALRAIFRKNDEKAANKAASSAAAQWAPAAVSASIASYGAAAASGTAAYAGALLVGTGLATGLAAGGGGGGFQKGGYTGLGSDTDVAGPAHKNEFVLSAPATRVLGLPFLEMLHGAAAKGSAFVQRMLGRRGYEDGGYVEGMPIEPRDLPGAGSDWGRISPGGYIEITGGDRPRAAITPSPSSATASGADRGGGVTASGGGPSSGGRGSFGTTPFAGYPGAGTVYPTSWSYQPGYGYVPRAQLATGGSGGGSGFGAGIGGPALSGGSQGGNTFGGMASSSFGAFLNAAAAARAGVKASLNQFASGGYTDGIMGKIAGFVHGKEFVFSAPAVDSLGVGFLQNMHQVALTKPAGYERGGFVGGGGGGAGAGGGDRGVRPVINQALFFDRDEARRWLLNQDGERQIMDLINNNRVELGL